MLPILLVAQDKGKGWDTETWLKIIFGFIAMGIGLLTAYKYYRSKKDKTSQARDAEKRYRNALKKELGTIHMFGSPDIESKTVDLEEAFVSLHISHSGEGRNRVSKPVPDSKAGGEFPYEMHLSPQEIMKRAFKQFPLLLLIGDPGSGKTTLLQFYAVNCMERSHENFEKLGIDRDILPIYFPLRELEFDGNSITVTLPRCLAKWSEKHVLDIPQSRFLTWLQQKKTLVLLDGLDEIDTKERRKAACSWIKGMCNGLGNAKFVVTSRATGYRKLDGIEFEVPHMRADIMDFSSLQQEEFLRKWFRSVFLSEYNEEGIPPREWAERREKLAAMRSQAFK